MVAPAPGSPDGSIGQPNLRLLTVAETALRLGFSENKVRHLYKRGRLRPVRLPGDRRVYFRELELEQLLRPELGSSTFSGDPRLAEPPRVLSFRPRRPRGG